MHPFKEEGIGTSFKAEHFLKAPSLIEVTEEGIDNETNEVHILKRNLLISVIKGGRVTFSSDEQFVKVKTPILKFKLKKNKERRIINTSN